MVSIETDIAGIKMKNPVMVASGTFGYGEKPAELIDLDKIGAIITKTVTLKPKQGNPPPRIVETPSGMLNTIGLQNVGIDVFLKEKVIFFKEYPATPLIVNIAGDSVEEYAEIARKLDKVALVKGIEVNVSCPNVKKGGMAFGIDPKSVAEVTKAVKRSTGLPVIIKLSPNVTDIALIALSAEKAGADALSLINTLLGMAIDIETRKPKLSMKVGGLSGPAIKPVAIRMVWQVTQKVKIPVIGIGGIMTTEDAIEFLLAGASAVEIGTANYVNPQAPIEIAAGIKEYLERNRLKSIKGLKLKYS